ncbi:hypothetical protein JCM8547_007376 [Rhodosporidiobolus lusitaniae]
MSYTTSHDPTFHPVYVPAYPPVPLPHPSPSLATPRLSLPASTSASFPVSSSCADGKSVEEGRKGLVRFSVREEGEGKRELQRQLRSRHIAMISLGGVIGTGLFLGSAQSLQKAGPLGLLLAFSVMGVWVWCMMISLGEMISHAPLAGGHISLASRFVDPSFGLATGYSYAANWLLVCPAELSASATLVGFWKGGSPAPWIAICYVVVVGINLGGTRVYGECEFWLCAIKIITILGLIVLGIIISAGGVPGTEPIGFSYYHSPGAFAQFLGIEGSLGRFAGFWAASLQAAYSYVGTEIVSLAAGEARNPSHSLPLSIRRVISRILLFYIAGCFVIGLIVPYTDTALSRHDGTAMSSPFVIAIERAGIKALPSVVNAAFLTAATSAASSGLYTASRCLYGLSINDMAPACFKRLNRYGLPWVAVCVSSAFGLLSFMAASEKSAKVFTWLSNFCSVGGVLSWASICVTYLRFYYGARAQDIPRSIFPYVGPCQPYAAILALVGFLLILLTNGFYLFIDGQWDGSEFTTRYLLLILFPIVYFSSKFYYSPSSSLSSKSVLSWPSLLELDYFSGSRDNDEADFHDGPKPKNVAQRVWRSLV